jgi:site-specific DNA-cytosine methylase
VGVKRIYTVIDLFSGTNSSTLAFRNAGHRVFGVEMDPRFTSELQANVLDLEAQDLFDLAGTRDIDYLWASPPCTAFSVAALRHNWRSFTTCKRCGADIEVVSDKVWTDCNCVDMFGERKKAYPLKPYRQIPVTVKAELGIAMVKHTIDLIEAVNPRYFTIENPRAMLRKMAIVQHLDMKTVTHCLYGDPSRMKPTDLWGGFPPDFEARHCKNGDTCHVAAPRGARTGTQALSGTPESAMVPIGISTEMLAAIEKADR